MTNPTKAVVTPANLGAQFVWNNTTKLFNILPVSADAGNLVSSGTDGSAKLTQATLQANQITYTFGYDNSAKKLTLYGTTSGNTTIVSAVDPTVFDVAFNGASINNGVITFTETNGATYNLDLNAFIQSLSLANTNAIALSGTGHAASPLTVSLVVDPEANNILKVGVAGARVDTGDILTFINSNITHSLVMDTVNSVLKSTINGTVASVGMTELQDAAGNHVGYVVT